MGKLINDHKEITKFSNWGCLLWPLIILIIVIAVAVILPQFMGSSGQRYHSPETSLWALRKTMEMYFADNNSYPKELNNLTNINSNNLKLINSLGRYTNVTNKLRAFENDEIWRKGQFG